MFIIFAPEKSYFQRIAPISNLSNPTYNQPNLKFPEINSVPEKRLPKSCFDVVVSVRLLLHRHVGH